MKIIKKTVAAVIAAALLIACIFMVPVLADDINVIADMNIGEGVALFYTTSYQDWASEFPSTGGRWPAYCIDHGLNSPWTGNMYYSGLTLSQQNRLGYVLRNGYPNRNWGLPGPEAQFLTQAAIYGIMGGHASMYEQIAGVPSAAFYYAYVFGYSYTEDSWSKPGNYSIAESLYNSAVSYASSDDSEYCILFEPYNTTAYLQRMAIPVPAYGSFRIRKVSGVDADCVSDNANYSLAGAVYGVFRDQECSQKECELTTAEDGLSEYANLDAGYYYIKEITPSRGYKLNNDTEVVRINAGSSATLDVIEPVEGDPVAINIIKESANGGGSVKLSGAEFTLTYTYPGNDGSERTMELVYESNENGVINLQNSSYLVSGEPYIDMETDSIEFFAGHITVRETKAPDGFMIDENFELNADLTVDDNGNISITYDTGDLVIDQKNIHAVNIPQIKVSTHASDEENQTQTATLGTNIIITDEVTVKDAVIGESVRLSGYPVFRSDFVDRDGVSFAAGDAVPYDSDRSIDSIEYTAQAETEVKELRFCLDTVRWNGAEMVLFTDVVAGPVSDSHHDLNDKNEFINVPSLPVIETHARDSSTGDHVGALWEESEIIDEVELSGLIPGTVYTLEGTLIFREDHEDSCGIVHYAGDPVPCLDNSENRKTFMSESEDMTIELHFSVDPADLDGADITVFENLYNKGVLFASHSDPEDDEQTIIYPRICTELTDTDRKTHFVHAQEEVTLVDSIAYENLIPGETYIIEGRLINAETGEALTDDMKNAVIACTDEFVPEEPDGIAEITFIFPGSCLEGVTAVAFERLYHGGIPVVRHEYLEDKSQTVYFAGINTSLKGQNGSTEAKAAEIVQLTDSVQYHNLDVTHEYKLTGLLTDKVSGKPVTDANGKEIKGSAIFTPKTPDGIAEVDFIFDGTIFEGKSVTAFEELTDLDLAMTVAAHKDPGSPSQTISFPKIRTVLSGSEGEKNVEAVNRNISLKDTVRFENLIPGKEYKLKGILMDKENKKPAVDEKGNPITGEAKFIPESRQGEIEIIFTFKPADLAGRSLVAFEVLENENGEIAVHADINDGAQTVSFYKPVYPSTGDANRTFIWIGIASVCTIIIGVLTIYRKRLLKNKR